MNVDFPNVSVVDDVDDAIYAIIEWADELYLDGRFDVVDTALATLDLDRLDTQNLVTVLMVASWAKEKLPRYARLIERIHAVFMEREPDRAELLMKV